MREDFEVPIIVMLALWLTMGLVLGSIRSIEQDDRGNKGCEYKTLAAFVNPGYMLGCELFRKRFNQ